MELRSNKNQLPKKIQNQKAHRKKWELESTKPIGMKLSTWRTRWTTCSYSMVTFISLSNRLLGRNLGSSWHSSFIRGNPKTWSLSSSRPWPRKVKRTPKSQRLKSTFHRYLPCNLKKGTKKIWLRNCTGNRSGTRKKKNQQSTLRMLARPIEI